MRGFTKAFGWPCIAMQKWEGWWWTGETNNVAEK